MSKDKIEKMDEDKFIGYLNEMTRNAKDHRETKLESKWTQAQKYYFGEKMGNEVKGKSQVISRDVSDSVDWMMPALMEIFASGKRAVMYQPTASVSAEIARQRTDYANHVFFNKNEGFMLMHDWFKDALLFNNGIIKHYWEESTEVTTELYEGLQEDELIALLSSDGVEVIERTYYEDTGLTDIRITKSRNTSQIRLKNIKPERFLVDEDAECVNSARFIGERKQVTISDLREMGYSEEQIDEVRNSNDDEGYGNLAYIRENYNGSSQYNEDERNGGDANLFVELIEAYTRIDFDGDGITELRRVVFANNTLLENDAWDAIPYSVLTPNPIQHEFYGQSIFDEVKDIQEIKTAILRNQLDNMYLTNNGRYAVVEGQVNLADLKNNTVGGVVREKMQGALRPLDQPHLPQGAYDMLGYMDERMTNRTGVSARSQGLDDKVLNSHTGQGQVNKVMSVAEQRQKLVARIFAETGVTDLFRAIYELSVKHQRTVEEFYKDGHLIKINPHEWEDNTTIKVIVGLGANNDDQKIAYLMRMLEMQQAAINQGGLDVITNEEKIYNTLAELTECIGYKDVDMFWLDPTTEQGLEAVKKKREAMAQPSPEQIKADADMKKAEMDAQMGMLDKQLEREKVQMEAQQQQREFELKERELAIKERELALNEDEMDLESRKFEWSKQVNISEVMLEKEMQKPVAIGDGKIYKGRNKGKTDSGNTG
ncbi:coil containing protein [Vibrio phage 1.262.O._10N.286.51.A9]|nr:coil containing protein [Vibrio phage 1.262.O._10N.286.51.A9]